MERNKLSQLSMEELQDLVQSELGEVPGDETAEELIDMLATKKRAGRKPKTAKAASRDDELVWVYVHNDNDPKASKQAYVCINGSNALIKREVWVKLKRFLYEGLRRAQIGKYDNKVLSHSRRYNVEMRTLEEGPGSGEVFGA